MAATRTSLIPTLPLLLLALALPLGTPGCDDIPESEPRTTPDGAIVPAPSADAAISPPPVDAQAPDAAAPAPPGAVVVPVSPTGHDRFFGVAFGAGDEIYATGNVAVSTDASADFAVVLAKFDAAGVLDTSFGTSGFAIKNLAVGTTGELARGIVVQSTGKIVISATVEHAGASDARDRDIALVRFDASGALDTTFGANGVVLLDLSSGEAVGTGFVADSVWGLARYADDRLLVSGAQKRSGGTDSDFAVVRLSADGAIDTGFGQNGVAQLDINHLNASPRTATILADGSALVSGYMNENGVTRPVIFELDGAGQLVPSFGAGGVFSQPVLGATTEVYGAALQGDKLVTTGYGRNLASESLDWVSLRLGADGTVDPTWGGSGVVRIDVAGFNDNSRSLTVLPDQRVLLVGGGRPSEANVDAMVALLTRDGAPDPSFSPTGYRLYDLGGASDFFWSVAVAPSQRRAVAVGVRGVGMSAGNDDASLLVLPLE